MLMNFLFKKGGYKGMHLQFLDEIIYLHHRFHFCGSSYYSFNVYQLSDTIGFHFSNWNRFSVRARFEVNFKSSPKKDINFNLW